MYIDFKERPHNPFDYNKADLMRSLKYDNLVLTNEQIEFFYDSIWNNIREALFEGKKVKVYRFGTFSLKKRPKIEKYTIRDGEHGSMESYPETITLKFTLSPFFKQELLNMQPKLQVAYKELQKNKQEFRLKRRKKNAKSTD